MVPDLKAQQSQKNSEISEAGRERQASILRKLGFDESLDTDYLAHQEKLNKEQ